MESIFGRRFRLQCDLDETNCWEFLRIVLDPDAFEKKVQSAITRDTMIEVHNSKPYDDWEFEERYINAAGLKYGTTYRHLLKPEKGISKFSHAEPLPSEKTKQENIEKTKMWSSPTCPNIPETECLEYFTRAAELCSTPKMVDALSSIFYFLGDPEPLTGEF